MHDPPFVHRKVILLMNIITITIISLGVASWVTALILSVLGIIRMITEHYYDRLAGLRFFAIAIILIIIGLAFIVYGFDRRIKETIENNQEMPVETITEEIENTEENNNQNWCLGYATGFVIGTFIYPAFIKNIKNKKED